MPPSFPTLHPQASELFHRGPLLLDFLVFGLNCGFKGKKEVNASKEKTEEEETTQTVLLKCVNQVREFMMTVDRTDNKGYFCRFNLTNFIHVGGREEKE